MFRILIAFIIAVSLPSFAAAQSAGGVFRALKDIRPDANMTIADLAGEWRIEVIDRPNSDFKGTASIPLGEGKSIMAQTITEDKCCGGRNHARVLQDSLITIHEDGEISVRSNIVKYLLREEEVNTRYSADHFYLRRVSENELVGTLNGGYTKVRWIRGELDVS